MEKTQFLRPCLILAAAATSLVAADGPGFTQPIGRSPGDVLATWDVSPGSSSRTTTAGYNRGYMFSDTRGSIGIQTWDISDWSNPTEVEKTAGLGTNHNNFLIGDYYLNASGSGSLARVWNMADMTDIREVSPSEYPFIRRGGNQRRDWFTLPIVYTGQNGYHPPQPIGQIVDSRNDEVLAQIDYEGDLGFPGQPLAIGNLLLVAASQTSSGVAAYDVSDMRNPVLLDVIQGANIGPGYEPSVWRHYVVLAMDDFGNSPDRVTLIDFSDPTDLKLAGTVNRPPGLSRYTQFQDRFMFVGDAKYDLEALLADPDKTFNGTSDAVLTFNGEDEYLLPLGNVVVTFDTSGGTTKAIVHDSQIDTTPPSIGYHLPLDGAVNQAVTSRIGLVINETLDPGSVNTSTILVRPVGGDPVAGVLSQTDKDVVNFHPNVNLQDNTTYEVVLPAGGVRDAAGNALTSEFSFVFSTGDSIVVGDQPPVVDSVSVPYPVLTGSTVEIGATASDPDGSAPLEYRWDFGDGDVSAWSTTSTIEHLFNQTGHVTVVLNVRDDQGLVTVKPLKVTVVDSVPSGPMARNSGPILFDSAGDALWTVNPDNDTLAKVSAATLSKTEEFPVGKKPMAVSMDLSGKLWLACADDDTVEVVDPTDGSRETIRFRYGARPVAVLCDAFGSAFVSLEGAGELVKIDVAARAIVGRLEVGPTPRALAIDATGSRLFVTRFISGDAWGEVREIGTVLFTPIRTYFLDPNTDPERDTGNDGRGLPNYLAALAISPDNTRALVPSKKDNILRGGAIDGQPLTHDLTTRAIAPVLDLVAGTEDFAGRIDLDNSSQPSAAWYSPLGDYAFVVLQGNNEIDVYDTFTGQVATRIVTGLAPQGVCYDPVRMRLFTKDFMDRAISVFEIGPFLRAGQVPVVRSQAVPTVASEKLSSTVLAGKQIFYNAADDRMSLDNYISCATCHLDGGHDGRTWDFTDRGEGLRNNISLQGRSGMLHGRVHWTGNFDEIQDFENDIRNEFGGEGFLADADWLDPEIQNPLGSKKKAGRSTPLDQLAAYVSSLGTQSLPRSPVKTELGKMTLQAQRGRMFFEAANCASCHAGAQFTDGLRHDVGTIKATSGMRIGGVLDGIDTPTLLGLHDTAPYLHDGSAATIEAVFTQFNAASAPGTDGRAHDLGDLSPQDRSDLIRYLMELDGHSPGSGTTGSGYVEVGGRISMEAEHGEFAPDQTIWQTVAEGLASGGEYINSVGNQSGTVPESEEPERMVRYPFSLATAGDYQLFMRVNALGAGLGDSIFWRIIPAGGTPSVWYRWWQGFSKPGTWDWEPWGIGSGTDATGEELFGLAPGDYVFEITYREKDTLIDKFVIQRTGLEVPADLGPAETPAETEVDPNAGMTTLAEWKLYRGVGEGTTFEEAMPGSSLATGLAYAFDVSGPDSSTSVAQELKPDPATGGFSFTFVRYPNRANAAYAVQGAGTLSGWADIAVADPGDLGMTNLDPENYSITETYSDEYPDGIITTIHGTMDEARWFFRVGVTEVSN